MVKETQLDTHEIDKLLADDDFIDDFDFSEDRSDQFVDSEGHFDGDSEDDLSDEFEFELDDSEGEDPEITELLDVADSAAGGAGLVASRDELSNAALDIENLDFSIYMGVKGLPLGLKMAIGVAVFFWILQLSGVIYLLKQPIVIRDEIRLLTAEIDLSQPPLMISEGAAGKGAEVLVTGAPDIPEIFLFTLYLPLYSLEGLKVFSAEIEIIQFQEGGRVVGDGQKQLQESLRFLLQEEIGERLREEIVDVKSHLNGLITPHIEEFFSERQVDLSKVKIRIHNPYVQ